MSPSFPPPPLLRRYKPVNLEPAFPRRELRDYIFDLHELDDALEKIEELKEGSKSRKRSGRAGTDVFSDDGMLR